eukprot:239087_1
MAPTTTAIWNTTSTTFVTQSAYTQHIEPAPVGILIETFCLLYLVILIIIYLYCLGMQRTNPDKFNHFLMQPPSNKLLYLATLIDIFIVFCEYYILYTYFMTWADYDDYWVAYCTPFEVKAADGSFPLCDADPYCSSVFHLTKYGNYLKCERDDNLISLIGWYMIPAILSCFCYYGYITVWCHVCKCCRKDNIPDPGSCSQFWKQENINSFKCAKCREYSFIAGLERSRWIILTYYFITVFLFCFTFEAAPNQSYKWIGADVLFSLFACVIANAVVKRYIVYKKYFFCQQELNDIENGIKMNDMTTNNVTIDENVELNTDYKSVTIYNESDDKILSVLVQNETIRDRNHSLWNKIFAHKKMKFTVENGLVYISAYDNNGNVLLSNFNTFGTQFTFDGVSLDEIENDDMTLITSVLDGSGNTVYGIKSVSSGNYLDGRGGEENPLMTNRNPKGDEYLNWILIKVNVGYAIKSVSSGKYFDGRNGESNPLMTLREPMNDKFVQWTFSSTNGGANNMAIQSVSSGKYLDGRGGEQDPLLTDRDPMNDKFLQWIFVPM